MHCLVSDKAGVQGICKTQYLIGENEKTNNIDVTKSKDLTHCHERIVKDVGLTYMEKCIDCQEVRLRTYSKCNPFNSDIVAFQNIGFDPK